MLTPVELTAGLWLAVWPIWGGVLLPSPDSLAPTPVIAIVQPADTTPADTRPADTRPADTGRPDARPADTLAALLTLSDEDLLKMVETDPASLGPLSIGAPSSAILFNAVSLPPGPYWDVAPNADVWATSETIANIQTAIETVNELFPDTVPIIIGDISDRTGGHLHRHETHQGGRDVDLGYYYKHGKGYWFAPGNASNLDLPRNWALVRALVVRTDVETILLDTRIQRLLYNYALSMGEDQAWLDRVFQFAKGSPDAIVRHVRLHNTHYHVRFYCPVAQELGRRAHPLLVQQKIVEPPVYTVQHVVRSGQTLGLLAKRYGTSVRAIMQANGLSTTQLRAGHAYSIPMRTPAPPPEPLVMRHRVLPPSTPSALTTVTWPTSEDLYGPGGER
ncbi:MAG: penicillin-insensitive murein endopeptidase [Acidobacteria bacterium]|nr:penicillin-insensitive murein endopeptidase [Acidobacteriota bacterium]